MNLIKYLPAVAWAAFVLYLGGRQFTDVPSYDLPLDKFVHFVLYAILGALAAAGWRSAGRRPHFLIPLLTALAVGTADELQQRSVATRSADWVDWGVDMVSVALAFGLIAPSRLGKKKVSADE